MTISTQLVYPPIPIRSFDWCAWIDGREEDASLYGWGKTEEDALYDLNANVDEADSHSALAYEDVKAFADAFHELMMERQQQQQQPQPATE